MRVTTTISRLTPLCKPCYRYSRWSCEHDRLERSYVYFAHIGDYVKVGHSKDPDGRMEWLRRPGGRTAKPRFTLDGRHFITSREPLHHLRAVEVRDARGAERQAHAALSDFDELGEWFVAEPAVLAWVREQRAGHDFTLLPRDGGEWERPQNSIEVAEMESLYRSLRIPYEDFLQGRASA